jgi:hypothetical protein
MHIAERVQLVPEVVQTGTFVFSFLPDNVCVVLEGRSMFVDTSVPVVASGVFHNIITFAAAVQCC